MKKKIVTIILTLSLAVSMVACSGEKKEEKKESSKTEKTTSDEKEKSNEPAAEDLNDYGITEEETQALAQMLRESISANWDEEGGNETFLFYLKQGFGDYFGTPYGASIGVGDLSMFDASIEKKSTDLHNSSTAIFATTVLEWKKEKNISEERYMTFWKKLMETENSDEEIDNLIAPMLDEN